MTPITDQQFAEAAAQLETDYKDTLGGQLRETHVDQLGYGRWLTDFITARQRGESQSQAIATMRKGYGIVPTPAPPAPVLGVRANGLNLETTDGKIHKVRGVTAFTAYQYWLDGRRGQLADFAAWTRSIDAEWWRVFGSWCPRLNGVPLTIFDPRGYAGTEYYDELPNFVEWLAGEGIKLWFVAFTDQDNGSPIQVLPAEQDDRFWRVREKLRQYDFVLLEYENESWKNGGTAKRLPADPSILSVRSAFPDGETPLYVGSILNVTTEHPPRTFDWPRKSKNLLETARLGLGSFPATGKPALAGEPMGIYEHDIPGRRSANPREHADFAAVVELYGAGMILHGDWEDLQRCIVPGPRAQMCADAVRDVWRAGIPADAAASGVYTRGGLQESPLEHVDRYDDSGHEVRQDGALRTFVMLQGAKATAVIVSPGAQHQIKPRIGYHVVSVRGPHGQIVELER